MTLTRQTERMELTVVNYERVLADDKDEVQKMITALSDKGLFFLDMDGPTCEQALEVLGAVYRQQRLFFDESLDVKNRYHTGARPKGFHTYDNGVEIIFLGRQEHIQQTLDLPDTLVPAQDEIFSTSTFLDTLLRQLAARICAAAEPPRPARLDRPDAPGPMSNLYFGVSAVAEPGTLIMPPHLDDTILTLIFYTQPFLEVLDRATGEWRHVEVNRRMPVVNVGEQLEVNSSGRFHIPKHQCFQTEHRIDIIAYELFESL